MTRIAHGMRTRLRRAALLNAACALSFVLPGSAAADPDGLTAGELAWLAAHAPVRFAPERAYGPFVYLAVDGTVQGLSIDYLQAIARHTGLRLAYLPPAPLAHNLALARGREADLVSSLRPTPERSAYLAFTQPYVSIPAVVVVRAEEKGGADLRALAGRTVAVGRSYAVERHVRERHPSVGWVAVADDREGLAGVREGRFDAAVADVASVRFIVHHHRLEGLRLGEPVGFEYALSFAYRRDWPELGAILEHGLRRLSAAERQVLHDRWVEPYRSVDADGDRTTLMAVGAGCVVLAMAVAPLALRKRRASE